MTPLVLIPGMMCDARLWGPLPDALARRMVIHAPCTEADSVPALAAALLADAPPRFHLAGLSMGGIVAMEVVRQAPERVERLALLDTNPFAETDAVRQRRPPQIARALAGDLAGVMREEMKPHYLAPGPRNQAVLDLCLAMALALGPEVFARQSHALSTRPDQCDALAAYPGPALVLMGRHDRLCPLDRHETMHRLLPASRLVIIEEAGHLPTLEQPEATWAALLAWSEGSGGAQHPA
ncbi:MAG: alpha/beta fold hydrolase [Alphaproteobacteria bacterium]|nr:alpha/beta fold hydrolase [Alphaproteobacteria bacterium]